MNTYHPKQPMAERAPNAYSAMKQKPTVGSLFKAAKSILKNAKALGIDLYKIGVQGSIPATVGVYNFHENLSDRTYRPASELTPYYATRAEHTAMLKTNPAEAEKMRSPDSFQDKRSEFQRRLVRMKDTVRAHLPKNAL